MIRNICLFTKGLIIHDYGGWWQEVVAEVEVVEAMETTVVGLVGGRDDGGGIGSDCDDRGKRMRDANHLWL